MSRDGRKPWETPIIYNDERWAEPKKAENMAAGAVSHGPSDNGEVRDASDVEEILRRPEREEREDYECNDTTPINYNKGPHDDELDSDDRDDLVHDQAPLDYDRGPHEDEFGIDDDEELEPADEGDGFPDI